ncbi:MAG: substrate-binding domain-containing protein, partial [Spirochaetia bacterium]|nr:substrate-binding domain-containing protein [Spirochaetia bacterium]
MIRKIFVKSVIVLLAIVFLFSAFQSVRLILQDARRGKLYLSQSEPARYHFMVILPTIEDEFFQKMWEGIQEAAAEMNVGVELQVPRNILELRSGTLELMEIARLSQVDGVALYVTNEEELKPAINRTVVSGIPVVTLESDAPMSRRSGFVGSNSFKLGQEIGRLMQAAQPKGAKAALLKNEYFSERASQWSIIQYGILTSLSSDNSHEIVTERKTQIGVLSSEEKSRQILYLNPEVNVIFCTSLVDTISAANVVAEFEKEDDIKLIGYGYNQEIARGLEAGYIYG